jgi:ankyrin repeat protein
MTARMPRQQTKQIILMSDFMQTVRHNTLLNTAFMRNIDVHQKDRAGNTALYWAIIHHNMHNAKLLLHYGCTLDVTSDGKKAPFCAIDANNLEILEYLVELGLEPSQCYQKETLLEYAKRLGSKEINAYLRKRSMK